MSFTNHTPNYNLPQYVGTDKPTFLGDFNNAMSAIDTALHNNAQNAGEGLSELQQAQAALTETQETLTEVQTEVANVSGIASTVNQNVQQALTAANDATTAANSATSQIQPAVTAANQASADAQAAQQVANGNVTTLNDLSERVTALEESAIETFTVTGAGSCAGATGISSGFSIGITEETRGITISNLTGEQLSWQITGGTEPNTAYPLQNGAIPDKYFIPGNYTKMSVSGNQGSGVRFTNFSYSIEYGKYQSGGE